MHHSVSRPNASLHHPPLQVHYLHWREKRHRLTVESTNRRLVFFAIVRACTLAGVSIAQVLVWRWMFSK